MFYRELIFDARDFPERLKGFNLLSEIPCRKIYEFTTFVPKHYLTIVTVSPKSGSHNYGCDEIIGMEIEFLNDSDNELDVMEKEGILRTILKTNNLLGKEKQLKV